MRHHRLATLPFALLLACSSLATGPSAPAAIELVSGGGQQGVAGYPLPEPVVVRVVDERGNPVRNIELKVTTTAPLAVVSSEDWRTDALGRVEFRWRMGASANGETVRVAIVGSTGADALTIPVEGGSRPVRAIAGGLQRYCVVTVDQRLGCWRALQQSTWPELPELTPTISFHPGAARFLDVAMVEDGSIGSRLGCAIRDDGGVSCFGDDLESLADIGGVHPPFSRLFANTQHNAPLYCALTAEGEAWCWGTNAAGQVGSGTTEPTTTPMRVATDVRFDQLALGGSYVCGLDETGTAWCWGSNRHGATGLGTYEGQALTPTAVATSQRFVVIRTLADVVTCAKPAAGAWWCWGASFFSTHLDATAVPQVADITIGPQLATPDDLGLSSDAAGNASWWGDLYPTMDLVATMEPRPVKIPFPVTRFAPAVRDRAACIEADAQGRWLCIDLLWLWGGFPSDESDGVGKRPLVHGVP